MFAMLLPMVALLWHAPGEIFGDVRLGEKYLPELPVELKCGDESVKGATDKAGSFRLSSRTGGKCELIVSYDKQTLSIQVVVFSKPAQYRLQIEKKADSYSLKRV
ncbi:MAG: hypothetical protein MNPFHGCM_01931 [Gemmatimonadaceae bacterium]|nr:hypothetical protein [Gemmatimonadaceae bacterium]